MVVASRVITLLVRGCVVCGALGGLSSPARAEERAIAVQWDGVQSLSTGTATSGEAGTTRLKFHLTAPDRECNGTLSTPSGERADGVWAVACPDGLTATGRFVGKGRGVGGEGSGIDGAGRRVVFVIGPPTQTTSTAKPTPAKPAAQPKSASPPPSKPDATADELNQAEIERKRAERAQELQEELRRNRIEAEAANAKRPIPPPSPPQSVALRTDPGNVVQCGFLKVEGLPVRKGSVDCKPSSRTGDGGRGMSSIDVANITVRLEPNNTFLSIGAERDLDGIGGFRSTSANELRDMVKRWGDSKKGSNYSGVVEGPFRHGKLNIVDGGDWACALGVVESAKRAWGAGGVRGYAFVRYCEQGTHTVSDENLRVLAAALRLE